MDYSLLEENPFTPEGDSAFAAISVLSVHSLLIRNLSSVRCAVKLMGYNLGKEMPINKGRDISVLVRCSEQLGFSSKGEGLSGVLVEGKIWDEVENYG